MAVNNPFLTLLKHDGESQGRIHTLNVSGPLALITAANGVGNLYIAATPADLISDYVEAGEMRHISARTQHITTGLLEIDGILHNDGVVAIL